MFQVHSIRLVTVVALGVLLALWGSAWAAQELTAGAAALEVRVLDAQVPPEPGERDEVLYRMEVISVLRSTVRVKPGDIIVVRADAMGQKAQDSELVESRAPARLAPGWLGVAYLDPDPKASGSEAGRQFVIAANGDSFEDIPEGPPSIRWTEPAEPVAK